MLALGREDLFSGVDVHYFMRLYEQNPASLQPSLTIDWNENGIQDVR